jgi:methionine aminopeptidase
MVEPGLITAAALDAVRALIAPGVTTAELDAAASEVILARGAESNFQLVRGYRHTTCISVNDQVVHGIPGERVLERATSSRSTPVRSSRAGTATRRSPSSCPAGTRLCGRRASGSRR